MSDVLAINAAAIMAIEDRNTRQAMRQLVDGWNVRNGNSGAGDKRFVTAAELGQLQGKVGGLERTVSRVSQARPEPKLTAAQINRVITELQAKVFESLLWKELGERLSGIDRSIIDEQLNRVAAVKKVADDLADEVRARLDLEGVTGSAIINLTDVTNDYAKKYEALITRTGDTESAIVRLDETNKAFSRTFEQISFKSERTDASITSLQEAGDGYVKKFDDISLLVKAADNKGSDALSGISTLQELYEGQARQIDTLYTKSGNAFAAISEESEVRVNADNAISKRIDTLVSSTNQSFAGVQDKFEAVTNRFSAVASDIERVDAMVGSNATLIQTETTARVTADNDLYGKYSVKIDQNGYVSGFGLMSTANNSTPFSDFIIRADRFAIGSPSGPGVAPTVPFIVKTTPEQLPDGTVVPPGTYMDYAMVKQLDGAFINAGLLYASEIYTGSQYIDLVSKEPLPVVSRSTYFNALYKPDRGPFFSQPERYLNALSGTLVFYGPSMHAYAPYLQRVRHCEPGGEPLTFVISASAAIDHWMSVWYRIGPGYDAGYQGGWQSNGEWIEERQGGYGSAAMTSQVTVYLADDQYIEFTVAPLSLNRGYWSIWSDRYPDMQDVCVSVVVSNL